MGRLKRCRDCTTEKPLDDFHADRTQRDGRASYCKPCVRERVRRSRAANPEMYERQKQDAIRAQRERDATPEGRRLKREREAAYYWANWKKRNAGKRESYLRHKDDYVRRARERELRKREAFVESVDPLVVLERADGVCGICGHDVDPFDFHVDHIHPLSRGGLHNYENTQPAHPFCNLSKKDRLQEELAA